MAGGSKLYNYVGNPTSWIDVLGLAACRGRIQAQGKNLEESMAWNRETPPTVSEGLEMIDALEASLSKGDRALRAKEFDKARQYVRNAGSNNGIENVSKTFQVKGTPHERVDIEVKTGKAFIPDPIP